MALFVLACFAFALGWLFANHRREIGTWIRYRTVLVHSALRVPRPSLGDYIRLSLFPTGRLFPVIAGGAGDDEEDDESEDEEENDDDSDDDEEESDDEEDDEKNKPSFLRRMARKHESRAKKEKKRADRLDAELKKLKAGKEGDDDEPNKANREALDEEKKGLEEERRSFRLEQAVEKVARKGIKAELDGKEKTVKLVDPDDALVHLEKAIRSGDVDADDLFDDDGKVKRDAVTEAITEIVEDKPHLVEEGGRKRRGSTDAGKGGRKSTSDKSVDEHLSDIRRHKK